MELHLEDHNGEPDPPEETSEVPNIISLQAVRESAASYYDSLGRCLEEIEKQLDVKTNREKTMRQTLPNSTAVAVSKSPFRTPYFENFPPSDDELAMGLITTVADREIPRTFVWKRDEERTLVHLVIARKKQLRNVELEMEKKRTEKTLKTLQISIEALHGDGNEVEAASMNELQDEISTNLEILKKTEQDLEELKSPLFPRDSLVSVPLKDYDWFDIAQYPDLQRHGDQDCRLRFCNKLDPSLKVGPWTKKEDSTLRIAVQKYGEHDWNAVSAEIEFRTQFACCSRYRILTIQDKKPKQRRPGNTGQPLFSARETANLLHFYIISHGFWTNFMFALPPNRTLIQSRRFWERHFDLSKTRGAWTERELKIMQNFARHGKKKENLKSLYALLPERLTSHVYKHFLRMFEKNPKGGWIERKDAAAAEALDQQPSGNDAYKTALMQKVYEHITTFVTEPFAENSALAISTILEMDQVIAPLNVLLVDMQLLPSDGKPDRSIIGHTLSETDRGLVELFANPSAAQPKINGRPRTGNPFGTIQEKHQPKDLQQKLELFKRPFNLPNLELSTEAVVLFPPSLATVNALIKLKELAFGVGIETQQDDSLFDKDDLAAMERRVKSMFLSSELLFTVKKPLLVRKQTETPVLEPKASCPKKPRRVHSKKTQAAQRFRWIAKIKEEKHLKNQKAREESKQRKIAKQQDKVGNLQLVEAVSEDSVQMLSQHVAEASRTNDVALTMQKQKDTKKRKTAVPVRQSKRLHRVSAVDMEAPG